MFRVNDKVRFRPGWNPADDLPSDGIFTIGAVAQLLRPDDHYVDPYYWGEPKWAWARGKTRLDVAGYSQVVFLEGVPEYETGLPKHTSDPESKGRCGFSGAWFEAA